MPDSPRAIVRKVLPINMADELWTGNYEKVLPVAIQDYEVSAVLPAIFYLFRFGHRRGRGGFLTTFAPDGGNSRASRRATTVERVATVLAGRPNFSGFEDGVERAILGDLLLCFGLGNVKHDLGRDKQIQRVAPTHYMASWIDLPDSAANLRGVPEMIVATLADQRRGDYLKPTQKGRFPVAGNYGENPLLRAFSQGVRREKPFADLAADRFDEGDQSVGLDQLLMIRLAQQVGAAPKKVAGKVHGQERWRIPNQRPIAETAARHFSEDIRRFVRSYAEVVPRAALVDMLEACIATGLTAVLTSVVEILFDWIETGCIADRNRYRPTGLLVDCSTGVDKNLRALAEQSFDDLSRRIERVPTVLTTLRLLDYMAKDNGRINKLDIQTRPYATDWLNLLGDLLHQRHEEAEFIHRQLEDNGAKLANALEEADYAEMAATLRNEENESNAIRRLAVALTGLMGSKLRSKLMGMVDSTLQIERPNGLAKKRSTTRGTAVTGSGRRKREVRSLIFTDSVLDYLVHVHLLRPGNKHGVRSLSVREFLDTVCDRYGFHVDVAPPGMTVSNELLHLNRRILERRLRDLGLLVGVNDAEAMKRLQPRFPLNKGN